MIKKRFRITDEESKLYFWVCVYENIDVMQKDISDFDSVPDHISGREKDVLGVCHPYTREIFENGVSKGISKNIGIIRVCEGYLSTGIVAHEVLHAAFWVYRVSKRIANFGKECGPREEDLAYIYGYLFAEVTAKLHKYDFWK